MFGMIQFGNALFGTISTDEVSTRGWIIQCPTVSDYEVEDADEVQTIDCGET